MTTQEKKHEVVIEKNGKDLYVAVVDTETKQLKTNHGIQKINWDDGDISTTFFPNQEVLPERTFLFRKKGRILVEYIDKTVLALEVV